MTPDWKIITYVNQLRESVGLVCDSIITDIDNVVTTAGYQYFEDNFGNDFSGVSKSLGFGNYAIGFNKDHLWSEKFRRFTIAHELGHLTIPSHREILDREMLHRSKPEFNSKDEIEIEADKFAINLLAPQNALIDACKFKKFNSMTIQTLSDYFKVSTYAIALRFIEVTELSCTLVICDYNGNIIYDKRSSSFFRGFVHQSIKNQKVKEGSQTFDFINKYTSEKESEIELNSWYPALSEVVLATECIIELGYNNKVLALIEPHKSSLFE